MTVSQDGLYPNRGGSLQTISRQLVDSSVSAITFPDIPQTFTNLRLIISGSVDQGTTLEIVFNANGDAGENYNDQTFVIAGSGTIAAGHGAQIAGILGVITGTGSGSNASGSIDVVFYNYVAAQYTNWIAMCSADNSGIPNTQITSGFWANPESITSLTASPVSGGTFSAGTIATLYGLQ